MTKSIYQFWISTDDNKERLRLPVLPSTIDIANGSRNESIDIANLGEVTIIQDPIAKTYSFSSFFPANSSSIVEYSDPQKPWDAIDILEKWKKSKKPLRFVVTGTPINVPVSIESLNYSENGGAVGEIKYDLSLKEFKFVTVRKIKVAIKQPVVQQTRPAAVPTAKAYTVKKGDTLWGIAKRYYGSGSQWTKIWNVNKDMLIKRDSRNRKDPGHWIYPGQELTIP